MERSKSPCRLILYSTLLWGFAAHGMMLLNKFSFHDDARLAFKIGATVSSGRWMLGVIKRFFEFVFGGTLYSLPLFNGLLALFFIAFVSLVLVKILRVENPLNCVILSGLMVAFPVVTAMMGYMYTLPYYLLGADMALAGAWLICRREGQKWRLLAGSFLAACSIGVYQASIPILLSVMTLHMMTQMRGADEAEEFRFFREGLLMALACALFMAMYFAFTALSLKIFNSQLTDYESISTLGFSGWDQYWERIKLAYREFFAPASGVMCDMYPLASLRWLYFAVLAAGSLLALDHAACLFKKSFRCGAEFLLLLAVFPLAVNFVCVMVDVELLHSLMVYSKVFVFVGFICFLENAERNHPGSRRLFWRLGQPALILVIVLYCYFSNICYYKAEFMQNQAIAYFTRLTARIEEAPGYSPYLSVVFLNKENKLDFNEPVIPEFERIKLIPYLHDREHRIINNYAWEDFMRMWCGYSPIVIKDTSPYEHLPEVEAMPRYPQNGSVRVIGKAVVVKF